MNKNKWDHDFVPHLFHLRAAGGGSLAQQLSGQAGNHPGQDALPCRATHTHLHSPNWGSVDTPTHLTETFGMWEETQLCRENPHTQTVAPYGDWFVFSTTSLYLNQMMLKETLFEDMLHCLCGQVKHLIAKFVCFGLLKWHPGQEQLHLGAKRLF